MSQPIWEYKDAIGITRRGTYVTSADDGRTYIFRREDTGIQDAVSGQHLRDAKIVQR